MPEPRWDTDDRGVGVRDAADFTAPIERLVQAASRPGWVTEDPQAHLIPHLEAAATELGLTIAKWADVDGVLELDLDLAGESNGARRAAAHQLVAAVAEASTHVRETQPGVFEVITGMLPGDGSFATHGHVLRIRT